MFRKTSLLLCCALAGCQAIWPLSRAPSTTDATGIGDGPGGVDVPGPSTDGPVDGWSRDGPATPDQISFDATVDAPFGDGPAAPDQNSGPPDGTGDAPTQDGPKTPDQSPGDGGLPGPWVVIAKGAFTMGSPTSELCRSFNEDPHQVTLTHDVELQATEVTQDQFQALMGYNPSHFGPSDGGAGCGSCPVETVSWYEAAAYCNALSKKAGKPPCYACSGSGKTLTCQEAAAYSGQMIYACSGYRLPTEAEWERAYRAGTTTAYYSGTNDKQACYKCQLDTNADKIAWYCANASGTQPAAQKQANAWGLFDMAGNVWEWCHDRYQDLLGLSPVTDPWGSASATTRVFRGGSWINEPERVRAAKRFNNPPASWYMYLGFRCARTLP